eukprot:2406047-Pleurochrysis_carterae.AAC.4
MECGSAAHAAARRQSFALAVIWPIGIPTLYAALLFLSRKDIRGRRPGPLVNAIRFLWAEYTRSCLFWEVRRPRFISEVGAGQWPRSAQDQNALWTANVRSVRSVYVRTVFFYVLYKRALCAV